MKSCKVRFLSIDTKSISHFLYMSICGHFFKLLFGCPMANFGPLLRRQPHSPDLNHLRFTYLTRSSPGASQRDWVPIQITQLGNSNLWQKCIYSSSCMVPSNWSSQLVDYAPHFILWLYLPHSSFSFVVVLPIIPHPSFH